MKNTVVAKFSHDDEISREERAQKLFGELMQGTGYVDAIIKTGAFHQASFELKEGILQAVLALLGKENEAAPAEKIKKARDEVRDGISKLKILHRKPPFFKV